MSDRTTGHTWGEPTVVVVAYRAAGHLAECLRCLGLGTSVVVVDNDASEATRRVVGLAAARYVRSPTNVGFAAAVNLGLRAGWDGVGDVLVLNPDARIDGAGVDQLRRALYEGDRKRAAVSPTLVDADGMPQRTSWPIPSPAQVWLDALGIGRFWKGRSFVIGAVLMMRGDVLMELGGFDERYFLYAEEADWQMRAQRAGWTVAVVDDVVATHVGGASSSDSDLRNRIFHASAEAFARRWYGAGGWLTMRVGSLVGALRRSMFGSPMARAENRNTLRLYLRGPARAERTRRRAA